ncbi:MAG: hypothetical protein MJ180_05395 [Candidatus Gastranaerophilales bacterium]|nr:hypothetical protein [Candidatus Gastranaerophilales bacterium]
MGNEIQDILLVDYKSGKVKFDLTYGYLDKIYDAFNFRTQKTENIEQFILNLDNESMPDNQYLLLEDMSNQENKVYNVELNLDGLEYKGVAKISKFFSPQGLGINLHLLENN